MASVRRLAAIMFTDIVGYTAFAQSDEAGALRLVQEQERLIRPLLEAHRGRKVKSMGDGLLIEFYNALDAVECAVDLQRHVHERNARWEGRSLQLRVGIHLGDVQRRGTDIFGDAVNIASRVEPLAAPGGICLSAQVYDQVHNKVPYQLEKLGPRSLKGVQEPMEVYRIVLPWAGSESAVRTPLRPHLAVLPLANISPDPKDEYFADGLTEELISSLSKIRDLRVIARTSVAQYKSTAKTVSQIGAELGVTSVLEGSVRKAGNRLRITLQLIDVGTQNHVWANSYDCELDDVFAIQTEIAGSTAGALQLELLGPERESIQKKPTSNLEAYDLYLRGMHATHQSFVEGFTESVKYFEEAIRKDPAFSRAYSCLGNTYIALAGFPLPPRDAFPRASELIAKALELDPSSSDVHTALGNLALQQEHNWAVAEREFKTAISLNPSNANAHYWYSTLLSVVNRTDEQVEELRTTTELDPLWEAPRIALAANHWRRGNFASAVTSAEGTRDRRPQDPLSHIVLAFFYASAGRMDDARREEELSSGPVSDDNRFQRALLWSQLGMPEEAQRLVAEWEEAAPTTYVPPVRIALLHAALGEKEKAFEWLERDYQFGGGFLWAVYRDSIWDSFRDDPRFRSMLKRLNLPTEVKWTRAAGAKH